MINRIVRVALPLLSLIVIFLGMSPEPPAIYSTWHGYQWWEPGSPVDPQALILGFTGILVAVLSELRRIGNRL